MNKKAFEIQFNWLFVLIAGAAILLFFLAVVVNQRGISETSSKATILKSIDAIIASAGVGTDTISITSIPDSNIEIDCGRISLGEVSKQYQSIILFAPGKISGDRLILQTMGFSIPYKAANLLYLTSPHLRYIIIGNSNLAKEVNKSLPPEFEKDFYQSMPQIKNTNNYRVKFIFFENMIDFPKAFEKMSDSDVSAIKVNGDFEKGTIDFYQKDGSSWSLKGSSSYLGISNIIGAVYIDTLEKYGCNMQNVFAKFNLVTKVLVERTKKLESTSLNINQECSKIYSRALIALNKILDSSSSFDKEDADILADSAKSLANENKNAQLYSCPVIY